MAMCVDVLRLSCQRNGITVASSMLAFACAAFAICAPDGVVQRRYLCGRDRNRLSANFTEITASPAHSPKGK